MTNNNDDKEDKEDISELILGVEKPIWLASTGEASTSKITGWTTIKPKYDNGFIDKGTVLIFSHIYTGPDGEEGLNFMMIRPGLASESGTPEFTQKEIYYFCKNGTFTLLNLERIEEISIIAGKVARKVFLKYFDYIQGIQLSFDTKIFSPRDLYVIMGPEESDMSNHRINIGEKISLKRLIEIYSTAVGQNLILK